MSDAFSRRGFSRLLFTGGAGLLLGASSVAHATDEPPSPVSPRIVTRLDPSGLEIELHLRNIRAQPLLLPRNLIVVAGALHTRGRSYPIGSMLDSLMIGGFARSRVGPRRPAALSLAPDAEGHYATFRGPVPPGLSGRGRARIQLEASRAPTMPGGSADVMPPHRLAELRVGGQVRYRT